jgi:hypothetical protein
MTTLASGIHVRVDQRGEALSLPGIGQLLGLAIVERATDEPLQAITAHSNVEQLIRQWDAVLSSPRRGRE